MEITIQVNSQLHSDAVIWNQDSQQFSNVLSELSGAGLYELTTEMLM